MLPGVGKPVGAANRIGGLAAKMSTKQQGGSSKIA